MLAHVWLRLGFVLVVVVVGAGCSSSAPGRATNPVSTTIAPTTTTTVPVVLGPLHKASEQAVSPVYKQGVARTPNHGAHASSHWPTGSAGLWLTTTTVESVGEQARAKSAKSSPPGSRS